MCRTCISNACAAAAAAARGGGCTSCVAGGFFGRNYDWSVDTPDECLVRVPAQPGRHASIGIAARGAFKVAGEFGVFLTAETIEACLPYATVDGVNDAGVAVSCHSVSEMDVGPAPGTRPGAATRMPASRLVREILDRCDSARAAAALARDVDLFVVPCSALQFLVADATGDACFVGIVSNRVVVTPQVKALTNFCLSEVRRTGCTPPESVGLERYERLTKGLGRVASAADMDRLLREFSFSRCYKAGDEQAWWSEMNGTPNAFCARYPRSPAVFYHNDTNEFAEAAAARLATFAKERVALEEARSHIRRTGTCPPKADAWITIHSCVYDLAHRAVDVRILEGDTSHHFEL